ncbi:pimeloyl-ACP methyl ester carboxylesterase [Micromonospora luteifusca]|uniref:Pimeloyl-ACP methyl ester carboxylesterase n=1 Tax=Micromonospora luteifusca TaxID=709860 RepID=A0ABS2LTC6_9ACTN|nr:alpha/beta fold hydrolase [Micromonospora luteifusca]MBM7491412.1 pimeloyl-ACP methyl ester carboxylesterase [Micromonospora luteifusca]
MSGTTPVVEQVRSADGTPIAFERSGTGPAIILVGGALSDRNTTRDIGAALAPDFTVFSYDRRGRGYSGDTAPYEIGREIDDLAALIAAAGGSAAVYGISSGAVLAALATAQGLPVTGLVLFEPPFQVGPHVGVWKDTTAQLIELIAAGDRDGAVETFLSASVGLPTEAITGMKAQPMWGSLTAIAHTLPYDEIVTAGGRMPADRLAAITAPTLAVDSTGSPQWLRDGSRAAAEAVPGGRSVSLDGGYHEVPPRTLAPALREFLLA